MALTTHLPDAAARDLVRRAREIIAGRLTPPPLATHPYVAEYLRDLLPGRPEDNGHGPAPAVSQQTRDWLNLQAYHGGQAVATFTTPDGVMAVLAVGFDEIRALRAGLTGVDLSGVAIEFPDPPLVFVPVARADAAAVDPAAEHADPEAERVGVS